MICAELARYHTDISMRACEYKIPAFGLDSLVFRYVDTPYRDNPLVLEKFSVGFLPYLYYTLQFRMLYGL